MANQIVLCNSNIIIKLLRSDVKTKNQFKLTVNDNIALSIITVTEIFYGAKKSEIQSLKEIFSGFRIYYLDVNSTKKFSELVASFFISHRIRIPDALIVSTALTNHIPLYTKTLKIKFYQLVETISKKSRCVKKQPRGRYSF